jgi:hypothetical protein
MKINVLTILSVLFMMSLASAVDMSGINDGEKIDAWELLRKEFGGAIEMYQNAHGTTIEYCPFNTCDAFSSSDHQKNRLADFVYMYFYYLPTSNHPSVFEFRKSCGDKYVDRIIERNSECCKNVLGNKQVKCVLERMAMKHKIRLKFVRYDEQQRNEVLVDLKTEFDKLQ